MAQARILRAARPIGAGATARKASAWFAFAVAVLGQWIFAYYIAFFYGTTTARGHFAAWTHVLTHGIVAGDVLGNVAIASHLFFAFALTLLGPLQFVPAIRTRFARFHRWNGRAYALITSCAALAGLYMIWVRGTVGDTLAHVETSAGAGLILLCAVMTVRCAIARKFDAHRRWALRLFLVANGVWFFRVGLMFWLIVNRGPAGFDPATFTGPFLAFLGFAVYALPLGVLELYLRTQTNRSRLAQWSVAIALTGLTLAMGVGIFGAFEGFWLPHLTRIE